MIDFSVTKKEARFILDSLIQIKWLNQRFIAASSDNELIASREKAAKLAEKMFKNIEKQLNKKETVNAS